MSIMELTTMNFKTKLTLCEEKRFQIHLKHDNCLDPIPNGRYGVDHSIICISITFDKREHYCNNCPKEKESYIHRLIANGELIRHKKDHGPFHYEITGEYTGDKSLQGSLDYFENERNEQ